mmetsp:Transcript_24932/g.49876  ORF Transcript_24932/g.49876 Transcript_24932/m.49876 type:complete len:205 (+) Transcript_24932:39-653(+)
MHCHPENREKQQYWQAVAARKADADAQDSLVDIVVEVLERECQINDGDLAQRTTRTSFDAERVPGLSLREFVERIKCFSGASSCSFVLAASYLNTLQRLDATYRPTILNVHRLMLAAVLVASKFVDDKFSTNKYWAKVGGVSLAELNRLELEFLLLVKFNLHTKREDYDHFVEELRERHQHLQTANSVHEPAAVPHPTRVSVCT